MKTNLNKRRKYITRLGILRSYHRRAVLNGDRQMVEHYSKEINKTEKDLKSV